MAEKLCTLHIYIPTLTHTKNTHIKTRVYPHTHDMCSMRQMEERWSQRQEETTHKLKRPQAKIVLIEDPKCVSDSRSGYVTINEDGRNGALVRDLFSVTAILPNRRQSVFTFDLRQVFPGRTYVGDLNAYNYKFTEFIRHPAAANFEKRLFFNNQETAWTGDLKKMSFYELRDRGFRLVLQKPPVVLHRTPESIASSAASQYSGRVTFDFLRIETPRNTYVPENL